MDSKTICTIPWNHTAILQNGDYGICCQCIYNSHGRLITDNVAERIDTDIDLVRNHPTYIELRKSMLDGEQHPLCKLCWDEESFGKKSKRLVQTELYPGLVEKIINSADKTGVIDTTEFPVNYIDFRLGNLCNLACLICGPVNSSLWQDYMDGGSFKAGEVDYNIVKVGNSWRVNSDDFQYYKTEHFKSLLDKVLPLTDRMYFTGGEPLINKKHYEILDTCIKLGTAKNITLEYNTNGTTLNPELLEQWKHFKRVEVCFSIDAIGPLAEYIRYPSKWSNIETNMRLFDNSAMTHLVGTVNCTVSILNVMHFPEFFTWYYKQDFKKFKSYPVWNRLVFPAFMNVRALPTKAKEEVTAYYNDFISKSDVPEIREHIYSIVEYMNQSDVEQKQFFKSRLTIGRQDVLRKQSVQQSIPWLASVFKDAFGV